MKPVTFETALKMGSNQSRWIVASRVYDSETVHDLLVGFVRVSISGTALFIREESDGEWLRMEELSGQMHHEPVWKRWTLDVLEPNSLNQKLHIDEDSPYPDFPGHIYEASRGGHAAELIRVSTLISS